MRKLLLLLVSLFIGIQVFAQTTVTGTVTDEEGMGIPGANVMVKGFAGVGAITNFDGKYTLKVPEGATTLVFSSVGLGAQEIEIAGKSVINVSLKVEDKALGEVVITAMGIEKTPDAVTSAQQIVTSEELTRGGSSTAVEALTAKVSGLQINQTSSGVVGSSSIRLRGSRSITGNNSALIVIDGVKSSLSVFKQLPPEVIKSVNVIKGAQGAALYGSDGVNGVIMVTTLGAAKVERIRVTVNQKFDFDLPAFIPERQRKYGQGWDGNKINVENGGWGPSFEDPEYKGKLLPYGAPLYDYNNDGMIDVNKNTFDATDDDPAALKSIFAPYGEDNVRDFFVTGFNSSTDVTVNASGKDKYALLSVGYVKRHFVVEKDELDKYSILFKGGMKMGRWSVDGSVNLLRRNTSTTYSGIYYYLLQSSSDVPIRRYRDYPDHAYAWNIYYKNPYWYIKHQRNNSASTYVSTIASLAFEVNKHINIKYVANLRNSSGDGMSYRDGWYHTLEYNLEDANEISSYLNKNNSQSVIYYGDLLLSFDYDLGENWHFQALAGSNYQDNSYKITSAGGSNLEIPGLYTIYNLKKPTLPYKLSNYKTHRNSIAVFGSVDLAFKDFLFFNATARNEWSSVLPKENNSFFYPSVGVSFIPTKAFDGLKGGALSYMKVSANLTQVGNASSIGVYDVNPVAGLGSGFPFSEDGPTKGGLSFQYDSAPTNQNIKPEFVTTMEASLDLGFFRNRVTLAGSVYNQDTKDMITYQSTSRTSGIYRNKINIGKMNTKGFEVDLGLKPVKTENFEWDLHLSYYKSKSEVTKVTDETDEVILQSSSMVGIYAEKGKQFPLIKANAYKRDKQGRVIVDYNSGNPKYTQELKEFGTSTPKHIIGLNTSLRFKGFEFGAVLDYRTGHKYYSGTVESFTFNGMLKESAEFDREAGGFVWPNSVYEDPNNPGSYIANETVKTGGDKGYQGVSEYYSSIHNRIGENFVFDAMALKVRELSLSYTLNDEQTGRFCNSVTVSVYARNPFILLADDNLHYNDPETSNTSGNSQGIASDSQYPSIKTYGFNVNVKF